MSETPKQIDADVIYERVREAHVTEAWQPQSHRLVNGTSVVALLEQILEELQRIRRATEGNG